MLSVIILIIILKFAMSQKNKIFPFKKKKKGVSTGPPNVYRQASGILGLL